LPAEALSELGFELEELYSEETDAALGNGGLGTSTSNGCGCSAGRRPNAPNLAYSVRAAMPPQAVSLRASWTRSRR